MTTAGQNLEKAASAFFTGIPATEILEALRNEYHRRAIRYRLVDETMRKKYGMTLQEFERAEVVKKENHSWQVENDAMEWEHAVEGLRYAESKLKKVSEFHDSTHQ